MSGQAALQKLSVSTQNCHLRISKTAFACQSLDLGGGTAQPRVSSQIVRSFIRAEPNNLRFVSVKGAGTNKFSSCPREQVKCKGRVVQQSLGSPHADAGYNPASRGCFDQTQFNAEGNSHRGMKFSEKYEL